MKKPDYNTKVDFKLFDFNDASLGIIIHVWDWYQSFHLTQKRRKKLQNFSKTTSNKKPQTSTAGHFIDTLCTFSAIQIGWSPAGSCRSHFMTNFGQRFWGFDIKNPTLWSSLPTEVRHTKSVASFKPLLKMYNHV